jgi:hypothetical protein
MSYSEHELLDRTNMVVEILETHLLGHSLMDKPTRPDHLDIQTHLVDASTHLAKAYQLIGRLPESFK